MRILTKSHFISTVLGNVDANRVMDVNDGYAKHLIANGLAVEHKETVRPSDVQEEKKTGFQGPVVKVQERGSLSPAAQALPPKTAKQSKAGEARKAAKKNVSR